MTQIIYIEKGRKQLDMYFQKIKSTTPRKINIMSKNTATKIQIEARMNISARAYRRTGELQTSIQVEPIQGGYQVVSNSPYALAVEDGTKPRTIHGRPMLKFYWDKIGKFIVTPQVHHPGSKAMNYMKDAILTVEEEIDRQIDRAITDALK